MVTYYVILDMSGVDHRNLHLSELIHKVYLGYFVKAVVADRLPVLGRVLTCASISGAALHDGTISFLYKLADEFRFEIMGVAPSLRC